MKAEQGHNFSLEKINLAELERRTGVSRARLRRLKANNFNQKPHGLVGQKQQSTLEAAVDHPWCDMEQTGSLLCRPVCRIGTARRVPHYAGKNGDVPAPRAGTQPFLWEVQLWQGGELGWMILYLRLWKRAAGFCVWTFPLLSLPNWRRNRISPRHLLCKYLTYRSGLLAISFWLGLAVSACL